MRHRRSDPAGGITPTMLDTALRRRPAPLVRAGFALALAAACAALMAPKARAGGGYVPHEVIVGYAPHAIASMTKAVRMATHSRLVAAPAPRSQLLHLPRHESVRAALRRLRGKPGIAYAEPNYIAHSAGSWIPNDPG